MSEENYQNLEDNTTQGAKTCALVSKIINFTYNATLCGFASYYYHVGGAAPACNNAVASDWGVIILVFAIFHAIQAARSFCFVNAIGGCVECAEFILYIVCMAKYYSAPAGSCTSNAAYHTWFEIEAMIILVKLIMVGVFFVVAAVSMCTCAAWFTAKMHEVKDSSTK